MKTPYDPRHRRRQKIIQALFSWSFQNTIEIPEDENFGPLDEIRGVTEKIIAKVPEIDDLIVKAAPERPLSQVSKVDLSVLRLAVYELLEKDAPLKVVVDEAVELAKEFGGETSSSFINGVLGTIIGSLGLEKEPEENGAISS